MRRLLEISALVLLAATGAMHADAGQVVTRDAFITGEIAWTTKGVRVGDREVAWPDVISITQDGPPVASATHSVTLQDGERWAVEVLGYEAGRLRVRLGDGSEQVLPVDRVTRVNFGADAAAQVGAESGTLLTVTGETLPGELMWINDTAVAVESVFGVMQMPRARVAAYVFNPPSPAAAAGGGDQVTLADGTVLRGTIAPHAGGLMLEHPALGRIAIEPGRVRAVHRAAGAGTPLATLTPRLEGTPLLSLAMTPVAPTAGDPRLRIWSGGSATYTLPNAGRFRALVGALGGSKGSSILRISAGGQVLLEKVIARDAEPEWVTVQAPAGDLTLAADFVQPLAIPSGVVLREARVETAP